MALFKILKGAEENLSSQKKREGFAYFTTDSNDFYIDISSDEGDIAGERKQLNANRAHYVISKNLYENADYDKLYIGDEQISLGRTRGESDYEDGRDNAGLNSIAVGINVSATGQSSSSFGENTEANGKSSHAEGYDTMSNGAYSHAEGESTKSLGQASHAEGQGAIASKLGSHAEGVNTQALEESSHAEGRETTASGYGAHSEGWQTLASSQYQHVQGKWNVADENNKYAHIVGKGTDKNNRANAHTLDWNGNAWFAGDAYVGGDSQDNSSKLSTESYVQDYSLPLITDENSEKYIIGIDAGGIYIMKK